MQIHQPSAALFLGLLCCLITLQLPVSGTNGVYFTGYGAKSRAMAGTSMALPQDSLIAMTNPAGMAWLESRRDVVSTYAYNEYWEDISGNALGKDGRADLNTFRHVASLEAGCIRQVNSRTSIGLTLAPLAGGIVHHRRREIDPPGRGPHKITVGYGALSPCAATKLGCKHSIGVSLDLVAAVMDVRGFQSIQVDFGSETPDKVTNNGWDLAPGIGVRVGWMMEVCPRIRIGAAYRSQTFMGRFKRYTGFITPRGRSNLPQRIDAGASLDLNDTTTLSVDVGRVYYNQVRIWSGPPFSPLRPKWGGQGGPGLGWKNQTILKVGIVHEEARLAYCPTFRLGINYGESPIPATRTNNNSSTPATTRMHLTAGVSWTDCCGKEWTVAYVGGLTNTIHGTDTSIPAATGGGRSDLTSSVHRVDISWGYSF